MLVTEQRGKQLVLPLHSIKGTPIQRPSSLPNQRFAYTDRSNTISDSNSRYTGRYIMFSVITNIYNNKTKGHTLMELFTATGKLKKFFFF